MLGFAGFVPAPVLFVSHANEVAPFGDFELQPEVAGLSIVCITLQDPDVELPGFFLALTTEFHCMGDDVQQASAFVCGQVGFGGEGSPRDEHTKRLLFHAHWQREMHSTCMARHVDGLDRRFCNAVLCAIHGCSRRIDVVNVI